MSQQRGMKRAEKVAKRKARLTVDARKRNINKALYVLKKKVEEAGHVHGEGCGHDHEGHEE